MLRVASTRHSGDLCWELRLQQHPCHTWDFKDSEPRVKVGKSQLPCSQRLRLRGSTSSDAGHRTPGPMIALKNMRTLLLLPGRTTTLIYTHIHTHTHREPKHTSRVKCVDDSLRRKQLQSSILWTLTSCKTKTKFNCRCLGVQLSVSHLVLPP